MSRGPEVTVHDANGQAYRQLKMSSQYNNTILFPADSISIGAYGAYLSFEINQNSFRFVSSANPVVAWTVYADDMARRKGEIKVASLINY